MREIQLTQGQIAIIDDEDYEYISGTKWYAWWNPCTRSFYARTNNKNYCSIYMHRVVLKVFGRKRLVDHINMNTLDNRKENLRICSQSMNMCNRGPTISNASGLKGVYWGKDNKKWRSRIMVNGKNIHLGRFETAEEAHAAYCNAAKHLHGEFFRAEYPEQTQKLNAAL